MKICDVVKNSIWYDPRVRKQIKEYMRCGADLICVGITDPRNDTEEVKKIGCPVRLAEINEVFYGKKKSIFTKINREIKTNIDMYKLIRDVKADIIHANDLNALIPAYYAAKRNKSKLIYDTHEIFLENPWIASNKIVHFVWSIFEKHIIGKVDLVVCVSHAASDYLKERYEMKNLMIVTNCISQETLSELSLLTKNRGFEVLNHGQYYGGRGYDIMVDSAKYIKDLSDVTLVLRGFGVLEDQLRKIVSDENAQNVRFDPPVKMLELITYASRSHVGIAMTEAISINFKLSVSNKIFEYAAAGLPVIMSNIPEHRYLNEKYHFGIILEKDTPECLADAIRKLHDNNDLYEECAKNSRILSKEITWENDFGKLLAFERNMISK